IIIYGGTNKQITEAEIDETLAHFEAGDLLLLQNEISNVNYLIHRAHEKGMLTVLNPSPITAELLEFDGLSLLDWMIVNHGEAEALAGISGGEPVDVIEALQAKYPRASIVMTLGKRGALCLSRGLLYFSCTYNYGKRVDTTGAGDTFTGYFLAGLSRGEPIDECMDMASRASGLSITIAGAANSIPDLETVLTAEPIELQ
ncbi:MAG: ribokinase, partial [Clostridia bacterium]|nr:ribokinase [Clostridia bacterium]